MGDFTITKEHSGNLKQYSYLRWDGEVKGDFAPT